MPNGRLIAPNAFDDATLTGSPAMAATLPVANFQDPARARVARSVGLPAPQYIRGDWTAMTACSGFTLWRHNLTGAATLRLKLWSGAGQTGTLLYDSGAVVLGTIVRWGELTWGVDVWGGWLFNNWPVASATLWFASVSALSFELQISDPANTAGYIQAARIFLGQYFSPSQNFSLGGKLSWQDDTTQERTDGGSLRSDTREPYRRLTFTWDELTEVDRAGLAEILRINGKSRDVFVCLYPDDAGTKGRDYSFAAKITQMPDLTGNIPLNFTSQLILDEA